jgi:hypothetical protein
LDFVITKAITTLEIFFASLPVFTNRIANSVTRAKHCLALDWRQDEIDVIGAKELRIDSPSPIPYFIDLGSITSPVTSITLPSLSFCSKLHKNARYLSETDSEQARKPSLR